MTGARQEPPTGEITELLQAHSAGDREAFDRLVPLVYEQLLTIARGQLRRWHDEGTLDTVGLAHEAYLRLVDSALPGVRARGHFYAIAARSMRLILVDAARARSSAKRGSGNRPLALDEIDLARDHPLESVIAIDTALRRLTELDERIASVFELRFFGGLTADESAEALEISPRTAHRDWLKAKALLRSELA